LNVAPIVASNILSVRVNQVGTIRRLRGGPGSFLGKLKPMH
jgi:hypothetical protein